MIIENNKDLKKFLKEYKSKDSIIIPISSDERKHPLDTDICLLYVHTFDNEYVLPLRHNECLNIDMPNLESKTKKYTIDKKRLLHFLDLDNVIDVTMLNYMNKGVGLDLDNLDTDAHSFLNMRFYKKPNMNRVIPVLKHIEKCRSIVKTLIDIIVKNEQPVNVSYNNEILDNLSFIEKNGLITTEGKVFSEYNLYTSTGRPSNRFGGINFAALNKKDGSRKQFISRFKNGVLVEFDYDAYHPRLIGDKIGYEFPKGNVHQHLADTYGLSYDEGKQLTFKYLYGGISQEIKDNPFFSKVDEYVKGLWKEWKSSKSIKSDIYSREIYRKNLSDMNPNKLFNYMIQLMETEQNVRTLDVLLHDVKDYESKMVLYNYDAFLFDFDYKKDGLKYLKEVKKILEWDGKYPTRVYMGDNYHNMREITEQFK